MVRAMHERAEAEGAGARSVSLRAEATILVLTRDAAARDHLMELAIERGYGLCCQTEGSEAVQVMMVEPPGLLVVDLDAKGGRELLRAVRAHAEWRRIPLLALTATNNPMIAVTADAPAFFMPELNGLEEAIAARLEPQDV